ncbi:DUF1501 domain-containing protein [Ramlibacter sp.]|uniref:DUF1501 domain-containing protein n=1 Tax=Ramlibacter sp. TaxID=1917967 RepID=UPI0035B218DF
MSPVHAPDPHRRWLLQVAAATSLLATGVRVARAQVAAPEAPRLVVVLLRGALDGLSLVVPHGEAAYRESRPTIAIAGPGEADGVLPLDARFGLHPAFAPMRPYFDSGRLAFVHASGSHDGTRSHFDAQDYMESGTPGVKRTADGWLNRLAGVLAGGQAAPAAQRLQVVGLGPAMPRILSGAAPIAALSTGRQATAPTAVDRPEIAQAFTRLYAGDDALSRTVREALATRREMMDVLASDDRAADAGALPLSGLAADMARLGTLMARDARVRLAFVPVGGWDTHANQGAGRGALANRFALLAQGLDELARALGEQIGATTILVLSEFGRTVRQNGTGGTDHGHGNVAMVLGGGVRGGRVFGRWPGLDAAALHEGRDLAITTDFRDIVADILERRFRLKDGQLATVLPGMPARAPVGLFG